MPRPRQKPSPRFLPQRHEHTADLPVARLSADDQSVDAAELPLSSELLELRDRSDQGARRRPRRLARGAAAAATHGMTAASTWCRPKIAIPLRPLAVATTLDKCPNGYQ